MRPLRSAAAALCLAACAAAPLPVIRDAPLPPVVRVCVEGYAPFVMQRDWYGLSLGVIGKPPGFEQPAGLSGMVFTGANASMLDGFDIEFAKLMISDLMGLTPAFYPYPDSSSMYVGLRNGECDVAISAVELDSDRALCSASCPDTSVQPLEELPATDYSTAVYQDRLKTMCCLEYGVPYLPASGFALFSRAVKGDTSLVNAILSYQVLNAATPVIIALVLFGWVMYLVERRVNGQQFHSQHAGVYFSFVAMATFGFGDLAPVSRAGRLLTVFWTIMSVLSLSAFTSVVSARLTTSQLSVYNIDSLSKVRAQEVCIEESYAAVARLVSDEFALNGDLRAHGVTLSSVEGCANAVLSGDSTVYITDRPLLMWLANEFFQGENDLYVSPIVRANPLSFAYPSGSTLRPHIDSAVITLLTNSTWEAARHNLETVWFPKDDLAVALDDSGINMPPFIAAVVLVCTWLATMFAAYVRKAVRNARGRGRTDEQRQSEAAEEEPGMAMLAAVRKAAAAAAAAAAEAASLAQQVEVLQAHSGLRARTAAATADNTGSSPKTQLQFDL